MSECVVRMEIPKSCWVCPFGIDGYIWDENDARTRHVKLCSQHRGEEYHVLKTDTIRPWYCDSFICSLPEGHGWLVDADALLRDIKQFHVSDGCFQHWLELQPTIVPATEVKK